MPEGEFFDVSELPSWHQLAVGAQAILLAEQADDPEDTLMVQLTLSEIAAMMFGLMLIGRMFPELLPSVDALRVKMQELSTAQQYFRKENDDPDE